MLKLLTFIFTIVPFLAMAQTADDTTKLTQMLGTHSISCTQKEAKPKQDELPIRFSVDQATHQILAQSPVKGEYSKFDDDHATVEVTPSWIMLTLTEDANIYKEFHIRYSLVGTTLEILGGFLNTDGDNGVGAPVALNCSLQ